MADIPRESGAARAAIDAAAVIAAQRRGAGRTPRQHGFVPVSKPDAVRPLKLPDGAQFAPPLSGEAHVKGPETGPESAEPGAEDRGAYDALAAARQDHDVIVAGLGTVTELLQKLHADIARQMAPQEEQQLAIAQLLAAVEQLRRLVDELLKKGTNQGPGLGYAASQQATVVEAGSADASKRWSSSAWEKIRDAVKKVLPWLWSMISKLVTVREWTLTGKVSTGILGLAEASVSVTFGQ